MVKQSILSRKIATAADLEAIDAKVKQIVDESVKFAEESEYPDPSEATEDVYVQPDYPFITD